MANKIFRYKYTIGNEDIAKVDIYLITPSDYKGENDSDEFRRRDDANVIVMKNELKRVMDKEYIPKFETMHEKTGVSTVIISELVKYALYYEIHRMDDSKKTTKFLYHDKSPSKGLKTSKTSIGFTIENIPGSSYKEQMLLRSKINYHVMLFKANNPGAPNEELKRFMVGMKKGIDYSEADQPVPPYKMDLESRIERAMATSSCKQSKELEDSEPHKVIRREVKNLYGTNSCIPADRLRKAAMRRRKRYNERLANFEKNWTP